MSFGLHKCLVIVYVLFSRFFNMSLIRWSLFGIKLSKILFYALKVIIDTNLN